MQISSTKIWVIREFVAGREIDWTFRVGVEWAAQPWLIQRNGKTEWVDQFDDLPEIAKELLRKEQA